MLVRIVTALIMAPLALAAIYLLEVQAFALVIGAIVAWASFEWAGLVFAGPAPEQAESATNNPVARLIVALVFVSTALALCGWLWLRPDMQGQWLIVASVCWAWAIVEVLIYPRQVAVSMQDAGRRPNLRWILFGLVVLPAAWAAMVLLKARDPDLLVVVCFLVWGADAGAYFVGKAMGQRKLAPKVSPGKTWEGAIGGGVVGVLAALGFGWWRVASVQQELLIWCCLVVGLVAVSVFGDLFESILKRSAGAKDSGRLLPGHGGILDRIDALIAVLPAMALALLFAFQL